MNSTSKNIAGSSVKIADLLCEMMDYGFLSEELVSLMLDTLDSSGWTTATLEKLMYSLKENIEPQIFDMVAEKIKQII